MGLVAYCETYAVLRAHRESTGVTSRLNRARVGQVVAQVSSPTHGDANQGPSLLRSGKQ